jgi:hypothetical protein
LRTSSGAVFVDYDGDGLLDLLRLQCGPIYRQRARPNGQFVGLSDAFQGHLHRDRYEQPIAVSKHRPQHVHGCHGPDGIKPVGWAGEATFTDLNGDGRPDLLVMNMAGAQHYYENVDGKTFVDKSAERFPKTPFGAMGVKFFDFDNDGRMDLFITDMHSDMVQEVDPPLEKAKAPRHLPDAQLLAPASQFVFGKRLLAQHRCRRIRGNLRPRRRGELLAVGTEHRRRQRRWLGRLFIASGMGFPFRYGINSMLLNDRGRRFADAEFVLGIEPRRMDEPTRGGST